MNDQLHHVLRAIRGETKDSQKHLRVFREFLGHVDNAGGMTGKQTTRHKPSMPPGAPRVGGRGAKRAKG